MNPSPVEPGIVCETREMRSEDGPHEQIQELPGMEYDVVEDSETDLRELMAVMQRDEKREVAEANREILSVIRSLGGDEHRYR